MIARHEALMNLLLEHGRMMVDDLAERFDVTTMTIRRDLDALEKEGLLTRVHGGCIPRIPRVDEQPFREKELQHTEEKEAIARAVVAHIADSSSLYLDTGTTCLKVARLLRAHRRHLLVCTNNLPAALELFGAESITVTVPGGKLASRSPDLVGPDGLVRLSEWRLDFAIVGADALDIDTGEFYSAEDATAAYSRRAQEQALQTVACIDSSKIGKRALAVAGRLRKGVTLCTDASLQKKDREHIHAHGADIWIARKETRRRP